MLLYGREFSPKPGTLTSASTRRDGLVTLPDLSATAVSAAGMPLPAGFIGSPVAYSTSSGTPASRIASLARVDRFARAALGVKYLVLTYYTAAIIVLVAIALLAGWWRASGRRLAGVVAWLLDAVLLFLASVPLGAWLAFAFDPLPTSPSAIVSSLLWTAVGIWLVALLLRAFLPPRYALAAVTLATAAVLALDQWLEAPLSFSVSLGYSPLEAARFYGLGNEPAAIMISAGLIGIALLADQFGEGRGRRFARWAVPLVGGLLVATAVLPMAGANLGVAIWGSFAVVLATRLVAGGRLTWRVVLVALAVSAIVALGAVWIDSIASAQTHVARAVSSAGASGLGVLGTILVRKAVASAAYLRATPWIVLFVVIYGWLSLRLVQAERTAPVDLCERPSVPRSDGGDPDRGDRRLPDGGFGNRDAHLADVHDVDRLWLRRADGLCRVCLAAR